MKFYNYIVSELLLEVFWSSLLPFVLIVYMKNVNASFSLTGIVLKWFKSDWKNKHNLIKIVLFSYTKKMNIYKKYIHQITHFQQIIMFYFEIISYRTYCWNILCSLIKINMKNVYSTHIFQVITLWIVFHFCSL